MKKIRFAAVFAFLAGLAFGLLGVAVVLYFTVPELRESSPIGYMTKYDPNCHPETGYHNGHWKEGDQEGEYLTCSKMEGKFYAWNGLHLAVEGQMVDGKREGEFLYYAKDGSVKEAVRYESGERVDDDS